MYKKTKKNPPKKKEEEVVAHEVWLKPYGLGRLIASVKVATVD
jgi:hypothetical protein